MTASLLCSTRTIWGCVWLCCSVELHCLATTSAGCTRGGRSRSCPLRSSTLRGRCSSARATVLVGAVKTHRSMFFFVVEPLPFTRPWPASAVVSARRAARARTTRKTFDHEAASKLGCFFCCLLFRTLQQSRRQKRDNNPCCPSVSFAALTHSAACRSPLPRLPGGSREWRNLVFCYWKWCVLFLVLAQYFLRTTRCSVHVVFTRVSG